LKDYFKKRNEEKFEIERKDFRKGRK